MAVRIAGVNIPVNKHVIIGLCAIYGIGKTRSGLICKKSNVQPSCKVKDLTEPELELLRDGVSQFNIEGDLRREVTMNVKRLMDLKCYRGTRHRRGLPMKSRTKTNARTRKGKRKPIKQ